jgi:hypothetical protein
MNLDVLCLMCGAVVKAESPKFEMPRHGLPSVNCMGIGKPGTPISLIHGPAVPARVLIAR